MPGDLERRLKRLEPAYAHEAFAQDQQRPAVADHGDGAGERAGLLVQRIPFHIRLSRMD
jgi:hypothetical protein